MRDIVSCHASCICHSVISCSWLEWSRKRLWSLDPAFSWTVMAGWPKPLCGESLCVNTVNHNHTFEKFSSTSWEKCGNVLFDVTLGRDKESHSVTSTPSASAQLMKSRSFYSAAITYTRRCVFLHVWVGVRCPLCTVCRNSSGIQASLVGMWLQLGPSDLVHHTAWVRSVRPSDNYCFDPKFLPLYSVLNVAANESAKWQCTIWAFLTKGTLYLQFRCRNQHPSLVPKSVPEVLSYQETSERSLQPWTYWLVNHKPWDCKTVLWNSFGGKQILLSLGSTGLGMGISFFNVFDI